MTSTSSTGYHPQSNGSSAAAAPSAFENRESARRKQRLARLDAMIGQREQAAERHHYYNKEVERLVGSLVIPGSRVLEIGSGLGDLLASLAAESGVGIDISPRIVAAAKKRHPQLDFGWLTWNATRYPLVRST
ncbi:MAG: hypothetical protein WDO74_21085 [Pseudomonadota bacterium]